jgi:hypothetical protein
VNDRAVSLVISGYNTFGGESHCEFSKSNPAFEQEINPMLERKRREYSSNEEEELLELDVRLLVILAASLDWRSRIGFWLKYVQVQNIPQMTMTEVQAILSSGKELIS